MYRGAEIILVRIVSVFVMNPLGTKPLNKAHESLPDNSKTGMCPRTIREENQKEGGRGYTRLGQFLNPLSPPPSPLSV